MKKMIKFLPLVVLPSLIVMACANAQTNNKVSQDETTNNDNGITMYTVTVDFDGGTNKDGDPTQTLEVRKGTYYKYFEKNMPGKADIVYPGRELKHYSLTSGGDPINGETYRFESDVRIYAVYNEVGTKHTVTWKNDGGTVLDTEAYYEGEIPTYKGSSDPTPEFPLPGVEYTFTGWSPTIHEVEADETYTATYSAVTTEHTVSFDAQGGQFQGGRTVDTRIVFHGYPILIAPEVLREGYHQTEDIKNKWYYKYQEEEREFKFGLNGTPVTSDFNLYCKWVPDVVTISFNAGVGSQYIKPITDIAYGSTVPVAVKPSNPTKEKATFVGWYQTEACTEGTEFIFNGESGTPTVVTEDMVLYAKWNITEKVNLTFKIVGDLQQYASWYCEAKKDNIYEYTLNDIEAGKTDINPEEYKAPDTSVYTFTCDPSMTLVGWEDVETGIIYPKAEHPLPPANKDATYSAIILGQEKAVHTITFYEAGGTKEWMKESVIHGEKAIQPINHPEILGMTFKHWSIKNSTDPFPFTTTEILTNYDLVAVYETNTYTVSFDTKGGTPVPSLPVTHGGTIEEAPKVTRKGYHQADEDKGKWYYKDSTGKEAEFTFGAEGTGTPVTSDMTLYCGDWIPDMVEVTFIAGEGSQYITPLQVNYNETISVDDEPIPTKEKHVFAYWYYSDGEGEHKFIFDDGVVANPTHVTSDMVLKAHWDEIEKVNLLFEVNNDDTPYASWVYTSPEGETDVLKSIAFNDKDYGFTINPENNYIKDEHEYVWTVDDSKMLVGWRDSTTGAIYESGAIPPTKVDTTYTAVLKDKPISTVTVTFKSTHDGTTYDVDFLTETVVPGGYAIEPKKEPTEDWEGHDFIGWYTEQEGGSLWNFDEDPITADTTLYAHFKEATQAKVSFVDQDGKDIASAPEQFIGHAVNGPRLNYWFPDNLHHETRLGVVGWRRQDTGAEVKVVTEDLKNTKLEPIGEQIDIDFEMDCTAEDTGTVYTIDGEGSYIHRQFDFGAPITFSFVKPSGHEYPARVILTITLSSGGQKTLDSGYYDPATGIITIETLTDANLEQANAIKITVYEN